MFGASVNLLQYINVFSAVRKPEFDWLLEKLYNELNTQLKNTVSDLVRESTGYHAKYFILQDHDIAYYFLNRS